MKQLTVITIAFIVLTLTSCQAIEGIFKAGVGVGVFLVLAVIAIIIFVIAKVTGK